MDTEQTNGEGTGSLEAALAHARAQAGATSATQATVPSAAATDLPDGVDAATVVWDEGLAAGGYATAVLRRGTVVRVTDGSGDTCVNLQLFNVALPSERLNPADTVKVQWEAYLGTGTLLLSDRGRVLATIVADTSGRHDALCGHANRAGNEARYGHGGAHGPTPNARDLLALGAARQGLERRDLTSGINLFTAVTVADDGSLQLVVPTETAAYVELRAELDLVLVVAVAPHPLDARAAYVAGPVRLTAWTAERPEPDPFRTSSPERQRAFENTEQLLLAGAR